MKYLRNLGLELNERQVYNLFVGEILKGIWCKLDLKERYLLLMLVLLVDDYGCLEYNPRIIRNEVFAEMNISLSRINKLIGNLVKHKIVEIHITNCGRKILYAKYLLGLLPKTTSQKPELPLPPNVDWYERNNDCYLVIHSG